MARTTDNRWLHRFAVLTAMATLLLLGVGGVVTSKGAGMAVPDWPTSYGYNMFALPFKYWTGGVFHEHTHRLVASVVGFLTLVLAAWLWMKESRAWLRWLGLIALVAVIFQGVLGGLRVVWFADQIGIFHATLAQLFFALVCAIALFTSKRWSADSLLRSNSDNAACGQGCPRSVSRLFLAATVLIFLQLVLGATMRHQHAGLAIPDFPTAYGKLWPATDSASVSGYNQVRQEVSALNPITASQILLQMTHRVMALAILIAVALVWKRARRSDAPSGLRRISTTWLGLILAQAGLGAWTIWSNKAADVATAHVLGGALSLVTGVLGCIICFRRAPVSVGAKPDAAGRESSHGGQYKACPAVS